MPRATRRLTAHVACLVVLGVAGLPSAVHGTAAPAEPAAPRQVAATAATPSCLGWMDTARPPDTILVGHVTDGVVTTSTAMAFRSYVRQALVGMLGSAGVTSITAATRPGLEAAAVAVKQFAWHRALNHREVGYSLADGSCFDVRDDDRDVDLSAAAGAEAGLVSAVDDALDATWTVTVRRPDLPEPFFLPRPAPGDASGCHALSADNILQVQLPIANALACARAGETREKILNRYFGSSVRTVDAIELAGGDRYGTAVAVSRAILPSPSGPVVYVASGESFPDALVAGPAAAAAGGVVLLVRAASIPASVDAELNRLKPAEIRVVGGPAVVSDAVVIALRTKAPAVRRIAGTNRYQTALAVAATAFPGRAATLFIATGTTYPDALSGGAAAAASGSPLLLVPAVLDASVQEPLATTIRRLQPDTIHVVGGPAAVSEAIATWLGTLGPTISRLAGSTRYETSAAVSEAVSVRGPRRVSIATGENFPDALVAAALRSPLLLVPGASGLPAKRTIDEFQRLDGSGMSVLGTSRIVRDRVVAALVGAATASAGILLPTYFNEAPAATTAFDSAGIPLVSYNGALQYNPVTIAQYGLANHGAWVSTHSSAARATMVKMADWLVSKQTADGRWLYTFAFATEPVPWWSGMAQGQAISLLLRTYQATGDEAYLDVARRAFTALARPISQKGSTLVDRGDTWIEEYLPPYSTHTLNGFLFALEGVREISLVTGDPAPRALYRAGIKTLHDFLPAFDTGSWSYYSIGSGRHVASLNYHVIHLLELRHYALIENDPVVALYAARFAADLTARTGFSATAPIRSWLTPTDLP